MISSPDDPERLASSAQQVSASDDSAVTSKHLRDSFCTLARQIVILLKTTLLNAGSRTKVWRMDARAATKATTEALESRWQALRPTILSTTTKVSLTSADIRSALERWRNQQGPSPPSRRWSHRSMPGRRYFAAALALALAVCAGFVVYCVATLPITGGLQVDATQSALTFESAQGEVFAARGVFKGDKLTAADLPAHLAQAIIAIEDRRFYQHNGVDFRGIMRAGWRNSQAGATREGASTITQQLARLMFLSPERSFRRKVQEALLALWLESQLKKEDILLRYLNTAYFGAGAYGVDAAAKRYFGKKAGELSPAESAMLAGLVRAPSQLAPTRNFGGAKERQEVVLQTWSKPRS